MTLLPLKVRPLALPPDTNSRFSVFITCTQRRRCQSGASCHLSLHNGLSTWQHRTEGRSSVHALRATRLARLWGCTCGPLEGTSGSDACETLDTFILTLQRHRATALYLTANCGLVQRAGCRDAGGEAGSVGALDLLAPQVPPKVELREGRSGTGVSGGRRCAATGSCSMEYKPSGLWRPAGHVCGTSSGGRCRTRQYPDMQPQNQQTARFNRLTTLVSSIQLMGWPPASISLRSKSPNMASSSTMPRFSSMCGCANCDTPGRLRPVSCKPYRSC